MGFLPTSYLLHSQVLARRPTLYFVLIEPLSVELVLGGLEMALSCEKVAALPSACTNLDAATALVCNGAAAYKLVSVWSDK